MPHKASSSTIASLRPDDDSDVDFDFGDDCHSQDGSISMSCTTAERGRPSMSSTTVERGRRVIFRDGISPGCSDDLSDFLGDHASEGSQSSEIADVIFIERNRLSVRVHDSETYGVQWKNPATPKKARAEIANALEELESLLEAALSETRADEVY